MSQTRETILAALETGINGVGGIQTVIRQKLTDTQLRNMGVPAVSIVDEGEQSIKRVGDYQISLMTVRLNCHVKQGGNDNKYFNELLDDLRAYILSASLDSNMQYIREVAVGTPDTGNEKANFNIELNIRYRFLRSDP